MDSLMDFAPCPRHMIDRTHFSGGLLGEGERPGRRVLRGGRPDAALTDVPHACSAHDRGKALQNGQVSRGRSVFQHVGPEKTSKQHENPLKINENHQNSSSKHVISCLKGGLRWGDPQ